LLKPLLLVAIAAAAVWAITAWPHINDVETGKTPEYPDLKPRDHAASVATVAHAAKAVIARMPAWTFVGAGQGPAGTEIQAVHTTRVWRFKDDVTIRITRPGGRTRVSVRSKSRVGAWDFGQNARNIREFLGALDRELS
jgi:uncharacterized protein (DUF1499 family)